MSDTTRERILDAAAAAFIEHGPAGARVDAIAAAAGVSKQLLYHYFKSKRGLLEAVMLRHLATRAPLDVGGAVDMAGMFRAALEDLHAHRPWLRLLAWEALQPEAGPLVAEAERRASLGEAMGHVATAQREGLLPADVPTDVAALALFGMCVAPFLAPQLAQLAVGSDPADPAFRERYADTLARLMFRGPSDGA